MIAEYSKAMKSIRDGVIKENVKTTFLKQDYDIKISEENGNIIIERKK